MLRATAYLVATLLLFLWMEVAQWLLHLRREPSANFIFAVFLMLFVPPTNAFRSWGKERWIRREANRRLATRMQGFRPSAVFWSRRLLLFAPTMMGLVVVTFAPETVAIAQHAFHPGSIRVGEYRISVPVTWIKIGVVNEEDIRQTMLLNAKGIARSDRHDFFWDVFLFPRWEVEFFDQKPSSFAGLKPGRNEVLSQRTIGLHSKDVECQELEYQGSNFRHVISACAIAKPPIFIRFSGDEKYRNDFYRFLQQNVRLEGQ